jgi:mannose-6-phosphate isomerase-like protein (cupin superfamily)
MAIEHDSTVNVEHGAGRLPDGVLSAGDVPAERFPGCEVHSYYNGPTDQLSGVSTGMAVLAPGAAPHEPHRHPEEEFMIVASGTGEIVVGDRTTPVGPGAIMYCGGDVLHGITNTGAGPMTFYWMKWTARGFPAG